MSSLLQWGDVPSWIQALGGMAQLGHVIWSVQQSRAQDYADRLRDDTGLTDQGLADAVQDSPAIASLTFQGLEASMRAHAMEKRALLSRVVSAAFAGDHARVDELELLLRTASALEPIDVRVLVEIAVPRPDSFPDAPMVGAIRQSAVGSTLPQDQADLVDPIVRKLDGEGLIKDEARGTYNYSAPAWLLSPYGFRFLRFLPDGESEIGDLRRAEVAVVHHGTKVILKNLGPARAEIRAVEASTDGDSMIGVPSLPVLVGPGERLEVPCDDLVPPNGGCRLVATWVDERDQERTTERIQWRR